MAYPAKVFRVAIASPSDVEQEREIAVRTLQDWNDQHSHTSGCVLLPIRWETHATPQVGRPQEVINREVVDQSDLLIGIFWTRIGTPTGAADSGTLEEIQRASAQGKRVMLFFSKAKQSPDSIDLAQLQQLRDFKSKIQDRALIDTFSDQVELRDKLLRSLHSSARELICLDQNKPDPLTIGFFDSSKGLFLPKDAPILLESVNLSYSDEDEIPDYPTKKTQGSGFDLILSAYDHNRYRKIARAHQERLSLRPLGFWIRNDGSFGARDIYVEFHFEAGEGGDLVLRHHSDLLSERDLGGYFDIGATKPRAGMCARIGDSDEPSREYSLEFPAIQPQRQIAMPTGLFAGSPGACEATITAQIYADILPVPIRQHLHFRIESNSRTASAIDVITESAPNEWDKHLAEKGSPKQMRSKMRIENRSLRYS